MLQASATVDCCMRNDLTGGRRNSNNNVVVDVGMVEEQFATLWWALAQQTARVARRADQLDETQSKLGNAAGTRWRPPSSAMNTTVSSGLGRLSVASRTVSSSGSSSSMSSASPMSSPRLVREICRKYPAGTSYIGGMPVYQSYVYEAPSTEVVAGPGSNNNVQLLRYVRVSQSNSMEQLPSSLRGSFRRPKSEVMPRKFDVATQQNRELEAAGSADCVRYESQDLGRDILDGDSCDRPASVNYSPIVVVVNRSSRLRHFCNSHSFDFNSCFKGN